ncbi:MAG: glycosyltransferase family 4 protein [Phycisphaeraceae bacterium]|nr:glycosyltransferase family 4 protein [Phycisphaeraceae bacterium]
MNRLVCTSDDGAAAVREKLPAAARAQGGPARVLFVNVGVLGFATTSGNLVHFAGLRDDIDAVHFTARMPRWLRAACAEPPVEVGGWDFQQSRMMLAWGAYLRRYFFGAGAWFPPDRFDVVHILTQQRGWVVREMSRRRASGEAAPRTVINLDATCRGWDSIRTYRRNAPAIDDAVERMILRRADAVACASEWCARGVETTARVPQERVIIHMPCARGLERAAGADRPSAARGAGALPRIVFVGGDWPNKGGADLLRWHQQRWADRAELHIVSGAAPVDRSCRNVIWHGAVDHAQLVGELLPSMDLFVVPTRWETFLIAAQEAQAAGLPVVTTRTGAVPEVVLDGQTGFLCPALHAGGEGAFVASVQRLLDDAALRVRMGEAARRHAQHNLSASVWHDHLLDQLVNLACGRAVQRRPMAHSPA